MSNIEQICMELQKIGSSLAESSAKIERERSEIISSMNQAQGAFGSSVEGQSLVQELFDALNEAVYADDSLYQLRSDVMQTINKIRK